MARHPLRPPIPQPLSQTPPEASAARLLRREGLERNPRLHSHPGAARPHPLHTLLRAREPQFRQEHFHRLPPRPGCSSPPLRREIVVWDPLTGQQHRVAFPPGLDYRAVDNFQAAVLCADAEDVHVHGDCFLSPFKLVFICVVYKQAFGSLYNSVSGVWGNIVSVVTPHRISMARPSILVRNALYWPTHGGDVLAFDFEMQSLSVIEKPANSHVTNMFCFQLLRMEDGVLGLAVLSELTIQLWERKSDCDGVFRWLLLQKIIPLEGMLPRGMPSDDRRVIFVGYDEDTNVIVLSTGVCKFILQLESMQIRKISETTDARAMAFHPYTNFYTAGRGVG